MEVKTRKEVERLDRINKLEEEPARERVRNLKSDRGMEFKVTNLPFASEIEVAAKRKVPARPFSRSLTTRRLLGTSEGKTGRNQAAEEL